MPAESPQTPHDTTDASTPWSPMGAVVAIVSLVTTIGVMSWFTAPAVGDRLLTVPVAVAITAGLVGQQGAPRGASR